MAAEVSNQIELLDGPSPPSAWHSRGCCHSKLPVQLARLPGWPRKLRASACRLAAAGSLLRGRHSTKTFPSPAAQMPSSVLGADSAQTRPSTCRLQHGLQHCMPLSLPVAVHRCQAIPALHVIASTFPITIAALKGLPVGTCCSASISLVRVAMLKGAGNSVGAACLLNVSLCGLRRSLHEVPPVLVLARQRLVAHQLQPRRGRGRRPCGRCTPRAHRILVRHHPLSIQLVFCQLLNVSQTLCYIPPENSYLHYNLSYPCTQADELSLQGALKPVHQTRQPQLQRVRKILSVKCCALTEA